MDQNKAIKFLYNLSSKLNKFYKSNSKKKLIINNKSKRKKIFNPVTNFDKSFEKMIRAYIVKSFPYDGIIGEEFKEKKTKTVKKESEIETLKITVRDITDKDIVSRNLTKNTSGVVIVDIANRSPLANLLSVNDIIIEVQKTPVKNSLDLNKLVDKIFKKGEKTLLLTIINNNNRRRYLGVKIN